MIIAVAAAAPTAAVLEETSFGSALESRPENQRTNLEPWKVFKPRDKVSKPLDQGFHWIYKFRTKVFKPREKAFKPLDQGFQLQNCRSLASELWNLKSWGRFGELALKRRRREPNLLAKTQTFGSRFQKLWAKGFQTFRPKLLKLEVWRLEVWDGSPVSGVFFVVVFCFLEREGVFKNPKP